MKFSPISFAAAVILVKPSDAKLSTPQSGLQALSDEQEAKLEGDAGYSWDSPMSISLSMEAEKSFMTVGVAATTDTDNGISSSKSGKSSKGNTQECRQFQGGINPGQGSRGNMFKIKATQDIVISGFTYYSRAIFGSEVDNVKIWEKCGDYEGFVNNSTAWSKIQDVGVIADRLTPLPKLENPIFVAKDSFLSFHIMTALDILYTEGQLEGSNYTHDSSITLYEGKGCQGEFDCPISPKVWNGFIDYCVVSTSKSGKSKSKSSKSSGVENTCPMLSATGPI